VAVFYKSRQIRQLPHRFESQVGNKLIEGWGWSCDRCKGHTIKARASSYLRLEYPLDLKSLKRYAKRHAERGWHRHKKKPRGSRLSGELLDLYYVESSLLESGSKGGSLASLFLPFLELSGPELFVPLLLEPPMSHPYPFSERV
jgi:hypothetical protein